PDEIRALDAHCRLHGIELVPNQQSFGHLHHWLKHPEYRHLAEVPEGILHPFLGAGQTTPEPFSLCPTDPRSLAFLGGLYDELLPCFTSGELNVGLDETIDLGPGRSAAAIREKGVGRVYLEFLRSVHGLVSARGKRMQFWADILLHHAELVPEVPKDAVAMLWGYEADHPFERETATLAEAGLPFYVCPGTSSWQSIGGRLDNMLANVHSAATWGAERGARGLLVTDWGDRGHLQPPCTAWSGFAVAASLAWNPEARVPAEGDRLENLLSRHLAALSPFHFAHHGKLIALARVGVLRGLPVRNASPLSLLLTKFDAPFPSPELTSLHPHTLNQLDEHLQSVLQRGPSAARFLPEFGAERSAEIESALLLEREINWAGELLRFACNLGFERLRAGDGRPLGQLPEQARHGLAERLEPLISEHRALWSTRSRHGGLDRSARWLERILAALRAPR
ncbi:MAG TPA: family 20 glycosylhydrolase, partial [Planctomycetota bacterium]